MNTGLSTLRRTLTKALLASTLLPATTFALKKEFTVTMVMPHADQATETGYKNYLARTDLSLRYVYVHSGSGVSPAQLRERVLATQPDLIYAWGTPTTLALAGRHDAPHTEFNLDHLPIVFTEVTDPVASGLLPSLENGRRNLTGVSHVAPLPVQINAMMSYRPFKRIGYLHNPAEPNSAIILKRLQSIASSHGFDVVDASLSEKNGGPYAADIAPKVAELALQKIDLLYVGPITFLAFTHRDAVTQAAMHHKLATFCTTESIVRKSGCLFGLFSNDLNVGRFAGSMTKQILSGEKVARDIPASTLQSFSLLVNMQTAQALELYPPMLLLNVAEVINAPKQAAFP